MVKDGAALAPRNVAGAKFPRRSARNGAQAAHRSGAPGGSPRLRREITSDSVLPTAMDRGHHAPRHYTRRWRSPPRRYRSWGAPDGRAGSERSSRVVASRSEQVVRSPIARKRWSNVRGQRGARRDHRASSPVHGGSRSIFPESVSRHGAAGAGAAPRVCVRLAPWLASLEHRSIACCIEQPNAIGVQSPRYSSAPLLQSRASGYQAPAVHGAKQVAAASLIASRRRPVPAAESTCGGLPRRSLAPQRGWRVAPGGALTMLDPEVGKSRRECETARI